MENLFRSERLIYRAIEDSDEEREFFHSIQSNIVAYANSDTGLLKPMTRKDSKAYWTYLTEKPLLAVVICLPAGASAGPGGAPSPDDKPLSIGCITLKGQKAGEERHRESYISIDIIAGQQGKGYGSEAIRWALDWGFRIAGLHRIGIECFSYNPEARRLYARLGFVFEGEKRESLWFNGSWHGYLTFSMLEHEWAAIKEKDSGAA